MAGNFKKLIAGDQLPSSAQVFNRLIDVAQGQDFDQRGRRGAAARSPYFGQTGIVMVRNDTEAAVGRFGILGLSEPLILPTDGHNEFQQRVAFKGIDPISRGKFAILLEPLTMGAIGYAIIDGVTLTRLTVDPDALLDYADVNPGVTGTLLNTASGSATVLWMERNGQTEQWAVVRLGSSSEPKTLFQAKFCMRTTADIPDYTRDGNTITYDDVGLIPTIDGGQPEIGDVVFWNLVEGHADNGLYEVVDDGADVGDGEVEPVLRRTLDLDASAKVRSGMMVHVTDGSPILGSGGAIATVASGAVTAVSNPGAKWSEAPTIRFLGGGGSGAEAHAVLTGQVVTSVVVDEGGSGYTSAPTVSIEGGIMPAAIYNYRNTLWALITADPVDLNTTELTFRRFPQKVVKQIVLAADELELDIGDADLVLLNGAYQVHGIKRSGALWNGRRVEIMSNPMGGTIVELVADSSTTTGTPFLFRPAPGGESEEGRVTDLYQLWPGQSVHLTCVGGDDSILDPGLYAWVVEIDNFMPEHSPAGAIFGGDTSQAFGTGAAATAVLTGDEVTSVTVDAGGADYSNTATAARFTGGDGTGATIGSLTVTGGAVISVTVGAGGSGYSAPPSVQFYSKVTYALEAEERPGVTIARRNAAGEYLQIGYGVRRPASDYLDGGDDATVSINFVGCDYNGLVDAGDGWLIVGGLVIRVGGGAEVFATVAALAAVAGDLADYIASNDAEIAALQADLAGLTTTVEGISDLLTALSDDVGAFQDATTTTLADHESRIAALEAP